jgi:hypothetical protein
MRFNWGFGIVVAACLFVAFILNLVYQCSQQQVDLVTDKYYEKELKYQEQIDQEKNVLALSGKLTVVAEPGQVVIRYPEDHQSGTMTGEVKFFRPDNAKLDFSVPVTSDAMNEQRIATGKVRQGWWNVQVQWNHGGKPYYQQEKVLIN